MKCTRWLAGVTLFSASVVWAQNLDDIVRKLQDVSKALSEIQKATSGAPGVQAEEHYRRGVGLLEKRQNREALAAFDQAIALDATKDVYFTMRGAAKNLLGQHDAALADANKALDLNPRNAQAYGERGYAKRFLKDLAGAMPDLTRAIELDPAHWRYYNQRGIVKASQQDHAGALDDYKSAVERNDRFSPLHSNVGWAKYRLGKAEESLGDFNRAIELDAKNAAALHGRGLALRSLNRNDDARRDLEKAVQIDPKNKPASDALASLASGASPISSGPAPAGTASPEQSRIATAPPATRSTAIAPSAVRTSGFLERFDGIPIAKQADPQLVSLAGAPWNPADGGTTGTGSFRLQDHRAQVERAQRNLRTIYGNLPYRQEQALDKLWAPFFDHPTPAAMQYFSKLNPLLNEFIATRVQLDGELAGAGEAVADLQVSAAVGSRRASAAAAETLARHGDAIKSQRQRLDELAKLIGDLGPAPNPLAAKAAARKLHTTAVGGPAKPGASGIVFGRLEEVGVSFVVPCTRIVITSTNSAYPEKRCRGEMFAYGDPAHARHADLVMEGDRFTINVEEKLPLHAFPAKGRITGVFNANRSMITEFEATFDLESPLTDDESMKKTNASHWSFRGKDVPLTRIFEEDRRTVIFELPAGASQRPESLRMVSTQRETWVDSNGVAGRGEIRLESPIVSQALFAIKLMLVAQSPIDQSRIAATKSPGPSPGRPDEDKADAEAIALHEALGRQIERDADRWAADAAREKDPKRREELEKRALETRANARAEQDIADSLKTGALVHTRTEWDKQAHGRMIEQIGVELRQFDSDNARMDRIHRLLMAGDGHLSKGIGDQVSAALKSQDRSAQLAKIESQVFAQLRAEKAFDLEARKTEQRVADTELARADAKVTAAETTQQGANYALLALSMLVSPATTLEMAATMGVGVSVGGVNGYIEDGPRGAVNGALHAVHPVMDVTLSAIEGGLKPDPETGKRGGWSGAFWSGGKAALVNGAMMIGNTIGTHAMKTGIEVPRVPAGERRPPVEIEAFKSNEQRYAEAASRAKTAQERATVDQQFKTIKERQKLREDMAQVKQRMEQNITNARARKPDGSVDLSHAEAKAAIERYKAEITDLRASSMASESRLPDLSKISNEQGLKVTNKRSEGGDIWLSGGGAQARAERHGCIGSQP